MRINILRGLLAACCLAAAPALALEAGGLDKDGNGLYDDEERYFVLEKLQEIYPELMAEGMFDVNSDNEVTVKEMHEGRHPLTILLREPYKKHAEEFADRPGTRIPWAIDLFPEWLMSAYFQEDAAVGAVAELKSRGIYPIPGAQENAARRPRKTKAGGGIEFAPGAFYQLDGHRDSRWSYRWLVFTFRLDGASATRDETVLVDVNANSRMPGRSTPRIWYSKKTGLNIQYIGQGKNGHDIRRMAGKDVVADGKTWNVVVAGMRQGSMFASLNGVPLASEKEQSGRFAYNMVGIDDPSNTKGMLTFFGDKNSGTASWAMDSLVMGQSEPSEAMVRKMEGWGAHRLGVTSILPHGHPYMIRRPVMDAEDFPYRYHHDDDTWVKWGTGMTKAATRGNTGGERREPEGFERVFIDDFRAKRLANSTSGDGDLWYGFGWNTSVGNAAPLVLPGREPDAYPYDAEKKQLTLSLVQQPGQDNRWRGSALYSVNDLAQGHSWFGPKVFRIRCMFPKIAENDLPKGLFPAFWSYGTEWIYWRTANRIENDWWEFDGANGWWINGISTHLHYTHLRNIPANVFGKNQGTYKRWKMFGTSMSEEVTKIPGGLFVWDGDFHTWEYVIDRDMTYINVTAKDKDGKERWYELCRYQTPQTYLERQDLQIDYSLKNGHELKANSPRQDFVIDFIEVLQRTDEIEKIPPPFADRPKLTKRGDEIVCEADIPGITDVRYYWFADGYPLTYGASAKYAVTAAEAGAEIRCMVKAVGALDQPEAWTESLSIAK